MKKKWERRKFLPKFLLCSTDPRFEMFPEREKRKKLEVQREKDRLRKRYEWLSLRIVYNLFLSRKIFLVTILFFEATLVARNKFGALLFHPRKRERVLGFFSIFTRYAWKQATAIIQKYRVIKPRKPGYVFQEDALETNIFRKKEWPVLKTLFYYALLKIENLI